MARAARFVGFVILAAVIVLIIQLPGFSRESRQLRRLETIQTQRTVAPISLPLGEAGFLLEPLVAEPLLSKPLALNSPQTKSATQADEAFSEADRLLQQGIQQYSRSQFQEALASWEQALKLYRETGDRAGEGVALGNLGLAHGALSQYEQAISFYQQQLTLSQEIGNRLGETHASLSLGWNFSFQGQYHLAIDFFNRALGIARDIGNLDRTAEALYALGWLHSNLGQNQEAIGLYQEALSIARQNENLYQEANILNGIGWANTALQKHQDAIVFFQEQLTIARAINNSRQEANALNGLGFVYAELNQYRQAILFSEQALAIHREINDLREEAYALGDLGNVYASLGDYQKALDYLMQCLTIQRGINNRWGEGITLSSIAKLLSTQNQPQLAIIFFKASVEVRESIRGDIRGLDTALQQSFTDTVADDYRLLADLLLQQDRIIEAQRVLDLLKIQELDDYLQDVQRNAQTESGVAYLRPEETILASYNALQQSAIEAGQTLAELKAIPQADRTEAQNQRIAELTALLDDINGDFRDFARSPEIRELIDQLSYEAQDASLRLNQLDGLRDELKQLNAAIFYPLILEDRLELVITVPDSPPLRRTVPVGREDLNRAILTFREALTNPNSNIEAPAQQLYRWLIEPLEADLAAAGIDTIIYSPDGQLRYIPLAALHDGEQWLIQRYQINNITAESLTNLTDTDRSQPRILAAAYADTSLVHTPEVNGTTYTFRGLPGAGDEVENLPTERTFLDEAFSLDALRPIMDEYTVLHLATHAAFVPGVPEDSFILFGNGDTPTLRDVEDWSLNGVDLVVLSACETGVGGLGNGEEVLGLGYQFQVSGAKAVMASLWQVSDRGTQILMGAFYDALDQGMTKTEALQWAQTALSTNDETILDEQRAGIGVSAAPNSNPTPLSHPYYWASFVIIGNGL